MQVELKRQRRCLNTDFSCDTKAEIAKLLIGVGLPLSKRPEQCPLLPLDAVPG